MGKLRVDAVERWSWGRDLVHYRDLGYAAVVHGEQLHFQGVDLPPLWEWFDGSEAIPARRVAQLRCGAKACNDIIGSAEHLYTSREPLLAVHYLRPDSLRAGHDKVTLHNALLHLLADNACTHGPLLAHPDDEPVVTWCRAHGDRTAPWSRVTDAVRRTGGWEARNLDLKTRQLSI